MTTINTSDDLLTLLRENQEFREAARKAILTEELLALPVRFSAFESETRSEFAELRSDVSEVRSDIVEIRSDIAEIRGDVSDLKEGQKRLEQRQQIHTTDIGELKGVSLETKLYNRGVSLIATLLRVHSGRRVRVAEMDDNSAEFNNVILKGLADGTLTEEEYDRILATDMIVSGRRTGSSSPVYTAIEASYSISRADIAKVSQTAKTLGKVFDNIEIHAVIYYMNVEPTIESEAVQQGVHLVRARN